jgi:hypothetical protein
MKSIKIILIILIAGFVTVSCSTTKTVTNVSAPDVSAKMVPIPEGKSVIYIVRPSAFGFAIKFKVLVDDVEIGSTMGTNFIYAIVNPGEHQILSKSENNEKMTLNTEAQKTYFIEQIPTMGLVIARNELKLLDEAVGKEKLSKCKLSSSLKAK